VKKLQEAKCGLAVSNAELPAYECKKKWSSCKC